MTKHLAVICYLLGVPIERYSFQPFPCLNWRFVFGVIQIQIGNCINIVPPLRNNQSKRYTGSFRFRIGFSRFKILPINRNWLQTFNFFHFNQIPILRVQQYPQIVNHFYRIPRSPARPIQCGNQRFELHDSSHRTFGSGGKIISFSQWFILASSKTNEQHA